MDNPLAPVSRSPDLLVILAVHNGEQTLAQVLDGYALAIAPAASWALVVVDNASTDGTAQILRDHAGRLPLHALHEPVAGKNAALNRALAELGPGRVACIFTDDDAVPDPDFLVAWGRVLHDHPDSVLFGGRISLEFMTAPPRWLARFAPWYRELYSQLEDLRDWPWAFSPLGPNMAVRHSVFAQGLRFHARIGPDHSRRLYPMGSETEFNDRVLTVTGLPAVFDPRPRVRHLVRPWQTTRAFVRARAFRLGYGMALLRQRNPQCYPGALNTGGPLRQGLRHVLAWLGVARFVWGVNWTRGLRAGMQQGERDTP